MLSYIWKITRSISNFCYIFIASLLLTAIIELEDQTWRIIYFIDEDAIVILEVFNKTTNKTPKKVIETCQRRLKQYFSG